MCKEKAWEEVENALWYLRELDPLYPGSPLGALRELQAGAQEPTVVAPNAQGESHAVT